MNAFGRLRYIVLAIRSSPQKFHRFKEICKNGAELHGTIPLNNETRWSSGYRMISRAIELANSVDLWVSENDDIKEYKLSIDDWKDLGNLNKCLETFSELETFLQAHKYTTIWMALASYNTFFDAIDDQRALYPDNQNLIDAFTKLKKYYELTNDCPANFVATILCTKYKLDYFVKNGFDAELSYIKKTFDSFSFFFYVLIV